MSTLAGPGAADGRLGIYTKSAATSGDDPGVVARLAKWELQAMVRALLPEERVRFCLLHRLPEEEWVKVLHAYKRGTAHYGGLMVCGSVWICPVCAMKIAEVRRHELQRAMKVYRGAGGHVFLVTFTVAHTRSDALRATLEGFLGAYRSMTSLRAYKALREAYRLEGTVRALEPTWGAANGWHPHAHVLLFLGADKPDRAALEDGLYDVWSRAAGLHGLTMNREHGLKVQHTTMSVDKYVTKFGRWEAPEEMTRAHTKRGRGERYTPFDLLRWVADTGEPRPAALFQEYAGVFKGRRQLTWSPGLRVLAQLGEEKSDQQIAEAVEEEAIVLALLGTREWQAVRQYHQRGQLLEVARSGDAGAVGRFVLELVKRMEQDGRAGYRDIWTGEPMQE